MCIHLTCAWKGLEVDVNKFFPSLSLFPGRSQGLPMTRTGGSMLIDQLHMISLKVRTCCMHAAVLSITSSDFNLNQYELMSCNANHFVFFVCVCAELATEFLTIVDKSPSRLKKRIQDNIRMAVEVRGKKERERERERGRDRERERCGYLFPCRVDAPTLPPIKEAIVILQYPPRPLPLL